MNLQVTTYAAGRAVTLVAALTPVAARLPESPVALAGHKKEPPRE